MWIIPGINPRPWCGSTSCKHTPAFPPAKSSSSLTCPAFSLHILGPLVRSSPVNAMNGKFLSSSLPHYSAQGIHLTVLFHITDSMPGINYQLMRHLDDSHNLTATQLQGNWETLCDVIVPHSDVRYIIIHDVSAAVGIYTRATNHINTSCDPLSFSNLDSKSGREAAKLACMVVGSSSQRRTVW